MHVSAAGVLGVHRLKMVPRFIDVCGCVSFLWVLEQSQARMATHLCTKGREGILNGGECATRTLGPIYQAGL